MSTLQTILHTITARQAAHLSRGGFPNRRGAKGFSRMKSQFDKPPTKDDHRVEEKQLQVQFVFFLRCRIGNDGQ